MSIVALKNPDGCVLKRAKSKCEAIPRNMSDKDSYQGRAITTCCKNRVALSGLRTRIAAWVNKIVNELSEALLPF